jgi:hypothetical protein
MAIGYTSLISKSSTLFFNHFLAAIEKNFILYSNDLKIITITDSGEAAEMIMHKVLRLFTKKESVLIKFKNQSGNFISCHIRNLGYLITENYSLEELLSQEEEDELFAFVRARYDDLRLRGRGIGFIFDSEGYSDDYIKIDIDVWNT